MGGIITTIITNLMEPPIDRRRVARSGDSVTQPRAIGGEMDSVADGLIISQRHRNIKVLLILRDKGTSLRMGVEV